MKSKPTFVDRARDHSHRLQLTPGEQSFLEDQGLVVCEECIFDGRGASSLWRPRHPDQYFDHGDGVVLCPPHLKESGYMNEASFDLWLFGLTGLGDETVSEMVSETYALRPNTIAKSPDVRLGRRLRKSLRHERVLDLREDGLSPAEIASEIRMPLRSVQRILQDGRREEPWTGEARDSGRAHIATLFGARDAEELQEWFDAWIGRELERLTASLAELDAERDRLTAELAERHAKCAALDAELAEQERTLIALRARAAELEANPLLRVNGRGVQLGGGGGAGDRRSPVSSGSLVPSRSTCTSSRGSPGGVRSPA